MQAQQRTTKKIKKNYQRKSVCRYCLFVEKYEKEQTSGANLMDRKSFDLFQ